MKYLREMAYQSWKPSDNESSIPCKWITNFSKKTLQSTTTTPETQTAAKLEFTSPYTTTCLNYTTIKTTMPLLKATTNTTTATGTGRCNCLRRSMSPPPPSSSPSSSFIYSGVFSIRIFHITHILLLTTLFLYSSSNLIVTAAPSHQSLMPTYPASLPLMLQQPELSNSVNATTTDGSQDDVLETNSVHGRHVNGGHHVHSTRALKRALLSNRSIVCNDGSLMSFYLRKNPNSKKWIVFLEGGWHCYDVRTCRARWNRLRHLMTSTDWPETRDVGGILSASPEENPYWHSANHVLVPYCSSDSWSGTNTTIDSPEFTFRFMGALILKQVIADLIPMGLGRIPGAELLLVGSSAGGLGVMLNLDRITHYLQHERKLQVTVRGVSDSGWFLDREPYTPSAVASSEAVRQGWSLWKGLLPEACVEQHKEEPWRCYFGYRLYPTLKTPLFVFQWLFDEAQMRADNVAAPVTPHQWNYIHAMGGALRSSLENVSAVFAPSCIGHAVLSKREWLTIKIDDISLPTALRCWEHSTRVHKKHHDKLKRSTEATINTSIDHKEGGKQQQRRREKHQREKQKERRERKRQNKNNNNGNGERKHLTKEEREERKRIRHEQKKRREERRNRRKNNMPVTAAEDRESNLTNAIRSSENATESQQQRRQHKRKRTEEEKQKRIQNRHKRRQRRKKEHHNSPDATSLQPERELQKEQPVTEAIVRQRHNSANKINRRSGVPRVPERCSLRLLERCSWPQCNHSCPTLTNPATGEEMRFLELLSSFGLDIEAVATALGVDMQTLNNMDRTELVNLLTQQVS